VAAQGNSMAPWSFPSQGMFDDRFNHTEYQTENTEGAMSNEQESFLKFKSNNTAVLNQSPSDTSSPRQANIVISVGKLDDQEA